MTALRASVLSLAIVIAGLLPAHGASADPTYNYVSYTDARSDASEGVDVIYTEASRDLYRGRLSFIVEGREFLKNKTDFVRIYIDTNDEDTGPEYRYSWYPGANPVVSTGTKSLYKTDSWESDGRKVRCATRQAINYTRDTITIQIPNSCLGDLSGPIKWSGAAGEITRRIPGAQFTGNFDYFPGKNRLPTGDAL